MRVMDPVHCRSPLGWSYCAIQGGKLAIVTSEILPSMCALWTSTRPKLEKPLARWRSFHGAVASCKQIAVVASVNLAPLASDAPSSAQCRMEFDRVIGEPLRR